MRTYFYKILYDNEIVVYVGVTTKTIQHRFLQHKKQKKLNDRYSAVELCHIDHPSIDSLEDYQRERLKVVELERKYIQEHKDMGCKLLNISDGGEWGTRILYNLMKENFFKKYSSYNGYEEYKNKIDKFKSWLRHWIRHKTTNKTKVWLRTWIIHRSYNKTKSWLKHWIIHRSYNKTKKWLRSWTFEKTNNKTKIWLRTWIIHRSYNKTKSWLRSWIHNGTKNKTKSWLRNWILHRTKNKTKSWLRNWINNRTTNKTKSWLNNWIGKRKNNIDN